ncbi:hypothetical protein [Actinobacillus vicugnae]|uniref:hypothetical protein n=1 Tax=Actinobacillus vicugnae TaxID=2573093 RepID=UPI001FCC9480|nr:hypothetical protein [Actinobacillus vicugnae]
MISLILLQGCYYSDGCFYSPQMVSCVDKGDIFPSIARFQKIDSVGKTNSEQRWKDAVKCGSKYEDVDLLYINEKGLYGKFEKCMMDKGYKRFHPAECGYQSPKWDKGVCNL